MQKMFYQGRHAKMTIIMALHTDKALSPELKKNAFVTIFNAEKSALAYFNRASNDFTKEEKIRNMEHCKIAFTPMLKYQKLIYVRPEDKFYKFTAAPHGSFKFGSSMFWKYCDEIQAKGTDISQSNKFMNDFV
jgi:hypothetical protein